MPAGDYTNICEARGRAPDGKGCTDKSKFPNAPRYCAKRSERGTGRCITGAVDTLSNT